MKTRDTLKLPHACAWLLGMALFFSFQTQASFLTACRAEVLQPAKFQPRDKQVLVFDSSPLYTNIPTEIAWRDVLVQIEPARHEQETVPAIYDEISETIEIERARTELHAEPATYKQTTRRVKMQDAYQRWRPNCVADAASCLETVPDQYDDIPVQLVENPARISQKSLPAKTIKVQRKVLKQAGKGNGITIPARYQTVQVAYVARPWQIKAEFRPAQYRTIQVQTKIRAEKLVTLPSVCADQLEAEQVQALQNALKQQGYAAPMTGNYDTATQKALIQFQQDQQIAVGALTNETLRKLGLF